MRHRRSDTYYMHARYDSRLLLVLLLLAPHFAAWCPSHTHTHTHTNTSIHLAILAAQSIMYHMCAMDPIRVVPACNIWYETHFGGAHGPSLLRALSVCVCDGMWGNVCVYVVIGYIKTKCDKKNTHYRVSIYPPYRHIWSRYMRVESNSNGV